MASRGRPRWRSAGRRSASRIASTNPSARRGWKPSSHRTLLLLVDAVHASIRAFEVAVRVAHLLDASDFAQELASPVLERGRRGFDAVVEAVRRNRLWSVEIEDRAVRHGEHRPTVRLHGRRKPENIDEQLLHRGEPIAVDDDGVPSKALNVHTSAPSLVGLKPATRLCTTRPGRAARRRRWRRPPRRRLRRHVVGSASGTLGCPRYARAVAHYLFNLVRRDAAPG